jgi:S-adenosylmethionine synthetase
MLAGEITSAAWVNVEAVTREAIKEIGYNDPNRRFNAAGVSVLNLFSRQAAGIACGVDNWNDVGADGQLRRPERR